MSQLTLYGHPDSGHVYKVALALSLSQIPYEYVWVDIWAPCETRPEIFQARSRFCEVPLLTDGDKSLTQSGAILQYLAREHGIFGGMQGYEQASEWIIWEANRIGMCLPQLVQSQKTPEDYPPDVINWLRGRLEIDQSRLANQLTNNPFVCGENITIADIAIFGYVSYALEKGIEFKDEIINWTQRIQRLPYFQTPDKLLT